MEPSGIDFMLKRFLQGKKLSLHMQCFNFAIVV